MANFAVLDGENVINTIVADSKTIAEEVTGKTCIEFTMESPAWINGTYTNGTFIPPKPYPSWILNGYNQWEAPVVKPEITEENPGPYGWNESTLSWEVIVF